MKLHIIKAVKPIDDSRLQILFDDDSTPVIDLAHILKQGGVFEPLRERQRFWAAQIGDRGRTIFWDVDDDIVDLCADALWLMVHPEDAPRDLLRD